MEQHQKRSRLQGLDQYRASKTVLFWACAGSAIVAVIVGFSWGGWVTGGSAQAMADKAAAQARQEVAAVVCVERFMDAQDASLQLTALKEMTSSYAQGKFIQDGGWATIADNSTDDRKAAGLCAEALGKQAMPTSGQAAQNAEPATAAQ